MTRDEFKVLISKCVWTEDDDGNWETGCGQRQVFICSGPVENHYLFCPYCGKTITINPERSHGDKP